VDHKKLIVPQLGATGVSAFKVKKLSGFQILWGPVRAEDIKGFVSSGYLVSKGMREVTFNLRERVVLIPVEITLILRYLMWLIPLFLFPHPLAPILP